MALEQVSVEPGGLPVGAAHHPILSPGRNCWRVDRARRASVLADGSAYFAALRDAFERAERSILIIGWDFDAGVALDPMGSGPASRPLRAYLPDLLSRREDLVVRILVWGCSIVYGQSASPPPLLDPEWPRHPRLRFRYANDHPIGASHHMKIVCVDDALAFCGGQDLTAGRWDVTGHDFDHRGRVDARGRPYPPKHDVQMVFDGEAAEALGLLARTRWREATGERVPPGDAQRDPWIPGLHVHLHDVPIGIARTRARCRDRHELREVEHLTLDALRAARDRVYVESQYLTSLSVRDCLVELLERPTGPEIVMVVRRSTQGRIQSFAMGSNRTRCLRRLARADRHGRLRVYYPVVGDAHGNEREIDVHSKVIAVDDRFLRVGSSNLNNRSMGFDSECDVAVEIEGHRDGAGVRRIVSELLGEHLGQDPHEVSRLLAGDRGLIGTVERLNVGARRRLVAFEHAMGPCEPLRWTAFADPCRSALPSWSLRAWPFARGARSES
jgi:phosphatidylserine/phosphatidylglycerophosphate/cardiolipin synthase-like enzyme